METPNQIWNIHIFGFFSEFLKELQNFEENYERNKDDELADYIEKFCGEAFWHEITSNIWEDKQ